MKISLHFVSLKLRRVAARCKVQFHMWKITVAPNTKREHKPVGGSSKNTTEEAHVTLHTVRVCGGNGWGVG